MFSIKFKHKAQPVSNPLRIRTLRREIARALTIKLEMEHKTEISSSRGSRSRILRTPPKAEVFKGGGVPKKLPLKVVKQEKQTEKK